MDLKGINKGGVFLKSEEKKIQGIVNELISNSLDAKAMDIQVSINRNSDKIVITVKDNGHGMNKDTLNAVHELLNQPHRYELEDYYGGLAGNSMTASGLNIVGILVDEATVESDSNKGTTITVVRKLK